MVHLKFILTPEASLRLHEALTCLSRFNEFVHIEARRDRLALTALNPSKSAYASVSLEKSRFFTFYDFVPRNASSNDRFTCSILNKALLSVFTNRVRDSRGRDTVIDRCEAVVEDGPEQIECRFVIKMICSQGVTKTYRLNYESVEVMHALFDRNTAPNRWSINSGRLKNLVDHFGPRTEQVDVYADNGRVTFTSFTEKVMDGNEILKQPLQTAVNIGTSDFESFQAQDKLHIVINVKDFRAIVSHAYTAENSLSASYSQPGRPLQFSHGRDGMHSEFTLMTIGETRNMPTPSESRAGSTIAGSRSQPSASAEANQRNKTTAMPPPSRPASRILKQPGSAKPISPSPRPSEEFESLFVPAEPSAEEQQWDPAQYQDEEETLGWDASASNDFGMHPTFRDSFPNPETSARDVGDGFAPTQQTTEFKGIFD